MGVETEEVVPGVGQVEAELVEHQEVQDATLVVDLDFHLLPGPTTLPEVQVR